MAAKELNKHILLETLRVYKEHGYNGSAAARAMGLPEATFKSRLKAANYRLGTVPDTMSQEYLDEHKNVPEVDILKAQLAQLQTLVATQQRNTLNEEFIKRQIFKLAEAPVTVPKWMLSKKSGSHVTGVPTLLASDWHWGEVVDARQVNGVNEYNIAIAQNRAKTMIEVTIDLLKNHIQHKEYPGIVFALGGDMVSGDIHEELTATNEKEIMPTVLDLWGTLVWCIKALAEEFGNVFIPCVTGNHGRNTHKIRSKGRNFTSFDWLCYQFLAKHFEGDRRVQFLIPDGSDAHWQLYGHKYVLTHGDQFRGGDGMIGALGPIIRGDHKKRSRNSQIDMEYDTLLLGHWHQLIQLQRLIVNGSLKGYDEYAYQNNFPYEPPRQALWITHPQFGITFSAPVMVERNTTVGKAEWITWK